MKIRVYVGTTEGPVAIERITREAAPNSAMCIGRSTREATANTGLRGLRQAALGRDRARARTIPAGRFPARCVGRHRRWRQLAPVAEAPRPAKPAKAVDAPAATTGFMAPRVRRTELQKLAEDMELMFVDNVTR